MGVESKDLLRHVEDPKELVEEGGKHPDDYKKIESYLERVERYPGSYPIQDNSGQTVLYPAGGKIGTVKIPLTDIEIAHGLKSGTSESFRWLAAWCARMVKKAALLGKKIVYPNFSRQT